MGASAMRNIAMPQLGETVADGTVTKWFKAVGDEIVKGEPLFEVSTDKVDTEIPAPVSGVLSEILVHEGETVDVGTILAMIDNDEPDDLAPLSSPAVTSADTTTTSSTRATGNAHRLSPAVRRRSGVDDHKRRGERPRRHRSRWPIDAEATSKRRSTPAGGRARRERRKIKSFLSPRCVGSPPNAWFSPRPRRPTP